ncbi:MAG: hypothetical protein HYT72_04070 [Candidatus Aenigmarchaeota archaeon]|nr:hypothetical protein [Candidatus Aenigmarchaeota archaeon]
MAEVTYMIGDRVTLHQLGRPVTGEFHGATSHAVYLIVGEDAHRRIKYYPFDSLDEYVRSVLGGIVVREVRK